MAEQIVEKRCPVILTQLDGMVKMVKQLGSYGPDSDLEGGNNEAAADIFDRVTKIAINQHSG